MKDKIWKHLRVEESTHKKVKALAVFKGVGIDETINDLIKLYNSKGNDNANRDYRKYNK